MSFEKLKKELRSCDYDDVELVVSLLEDDVRIRQLEQLYVPYSGMYRRLSIEDVARLTIWRSKKVGPEIVVDEIESYLEAEYIDAKLATTFTGIHVNEAIEIADCISLVPYKSLPMSLDMATRETAKPLSILPCADSAIVVTGKIKKTLNEICDTADILSETYGPSFMLTDFLSYALATVPGCSPTVLGHLILLDDSIPGSCYMNDTGEQMPFDAFSVHRNT